MAPIGWVCSCQDENSSAQQSANPWGGTSAMGPNAAVLLDRPGRPAYPSIVALPVGCGLRKELAHFRKSNGPRRILTRP